MESNIISISGVQGSGKTTVAYHLKSLIPDTVIYDGKRELERYLGNPDKKGTVIIVEYTSSILFPHANLNAATVDRFLNCGLIDKQYFQKGKHFFLDLQSVETQSERLLKRHDRMGKGYIKMIGKEFVHRSKYLRMLSDKGYFTKTICVDGMSIDEITQEIMDEIA